jgi:hypothetical protein
MNISSSSRLTASPFLCGLVALVWAACGGSKSSPEQTGQTCTPTKDDATGGCFKDLQESIKGTPMCLTRVPEGYCTHTCQTDSDCCAVKGECKSGLIQVCAPFESTGAKYCFLSCEAKDIPKDMDDSTFCQENANAAFICRSTGGGNENRKVCVPNG